MELFLWFIDFIWNLLSDHNTEWKKNAILNQLSELKRRFLEMRIKPRHIKKPSQHYLFLHDNYI